jgi:hypothetical protein
MTEANNLPADMQCHAISGTHKKSKFLPLSKKASIFEIFLGVHNSIAMSSLKTLYPGGIRT